MSVVLTRAMKIEALLAMKSWLYTTTERQSGVRGALALANGNEAYSAWEKWTDLALEVSNRQSVRRWDLLANVNTCLKKLEDVGSSTNNVPTTCT